ncbi:12621_t:CDS:2 [Acaulospora colombiana]|uniref:12621_t:CDS:1 n=1 Tax=Acaulospora colombiana TaxID=27376 RepID=A0ACA9L687_9GLOM|nr:12621_t:CDS:2 [Acaulospora colombiana]
MEARIESARKASEIHKKRTGKALRITPEDVRNEEMYQEVDNEEQEKLEQFHRESDASKVELLSQTMRILDNTHGRYCCVSQISVETIATISSTKVSPVNSHSLTEFTFAGHGCISLNREFSCFEQHVPQNVIGRTWRDRQGFVFNRNPTVKNLTIHDPSSSTIL